MKKIIIPSLLVCSLFAAEQNFVEIGVGFMQEKDNFSTNSDSKINSYSSAKSKSDTSPNFSFYYGDNIGENSTFYVASEFGSLVLGSELETNIGLFDFGLKTELMNESWENPFLLNSSRTKTDVTEVGAYLSYGIPLSDNYLASLRYEYSTVDYKKDTVVSDLKRDGKRHIISLENMYELSEDTQFMGNIRYEKYSAEGKASSYNNIGLELMMENKLTNNLELTLMGGFSKKDYDKSNPIFNKKIDSTTTSMHASLKFKELLDYKDTYISLSAGYEKEDANHNFYDKESKLGMLSFGYNF